MRRSSHFKISSDGLEVFQSFKGFQGCERRRIIMLSLSLSINFKISPNAFQAT